jgi:hypothetical protein
MNCSLPVCVILRQQVALEEEKTLSSRYKNQVDVLNQEIDQLNQQLAASVTKVVQSFSSY